MNRKFQFLRKEVLAFLGCDPERTAEATRLPIVDGRVLDPDARLQRQARVYGLWERAKHFEPEALDAAERAERDALAEHLELCLEELDAAEREG